MTALVEKYRPVAVGSLGGGPAREIATQVKKLCQAREVPFRSLTVQDFAALSGAFYEGLRTESVTVGEGGGLENALRRVRVMEAAEAWRFDRKASKVDVSPLIAVAGALFVAQEQAVSKGVSMVGF